MAALATVTVFLTLAGGLASLGLQERNLYLRQTAENQALHIAEAGVNYYRWHLAHAEGDFFDGTGADPDGIPPNGPYLHTYISSSGDLRGVFSLEITEPVVGSTITTIKSTGWTDEFPQIKKIITVKYGIPSLAHYSLLTNSDVWFGDNESIRGEMHSNGGVRMDGTNDSMVTSARSVYDCGPRHGCNSTNCNSPCTWDDINLNCECPGTWGGGPDYSLWNFPVLNIDFNSITMDMAEIKSEAQDSGVYLGSQGKGLHIIFQSDGTFDVYKITQLNSSIWQFNDTWGGWEKIEEEINNESLIANYAIPANGLIFVEDDVWVEGTVNGRVTLASGELPDNPSKRTIIHINDNINYLTRDGTHILGLIAQKHIKVPRHAPTDLTIDAIMLAQNGRVFRNYYETHAIKNSIEVYGGIITNQTWTWAWVNGSGDTTDGYDYTTSIYDSDATFAAPPYFPTTGEYAVITWEESQ